VVCVSNRFDLVWDWFGEISKVCPQLQTILRHASTRNTKHWSPSLFVYYTARELVLKLTMAKYECNSRLDEDLPMLDTTRSYRLADSCFVAESEQKWQELQATEIKRKALLKRTGGSFFNILFSYEGTFWRIMTRDVLLWFTVGVYVLLRLLAHLSGTVFYVSANQIGALGAMVT
jgi:hypothetical protein